MREVAFCFFGANKIATIYLQIPEAEMTLSILAPSIFFVSISSVLRGYFNGRENISATANSQSLEQIFKTILTILLVEIISNISSRNTTIMAATATMATTLSTFFSFVYLFIFFNRRKKYMWTEVLFSSKQYKKESIWKVLKYIVYVSVPITVTSLLSVASKSIDAFTIVRLLKESIGEEAAKIQYGILSGKIETLITLPFSFNIALATTLVPSISSSIAKGHIKIAEKRIQFSVLATILIGLPCTIAIYCFAEGILDLLFPNASSGAQMLQMSSLSIIFVVLTQTINGALQGMGKVIFPVIALLCGCISKLVLNLLLIPIETLGINGAIISSIVSHVISFVITFIILKKYIKSTFSIDRFIIRPIFATIIMYIICYNTYIKLVGIISNKIALLLSLFIGMIIYIISIVLLNVLTEEEYSMIPYGQKIYGILKKLKIRKP